MAALLTHPLILLVFRRAKLVSSEDENEKLRTRESELTLELNMLKLQGGGGQSSSSAAPSTAPGHGAVWSKEEFEAFGPLSRLTPEFRAELEGFVRDKVHEAGAPGRVLNSVRSGAMAAMLLGFASRLVPGNGGRLSSREEVSGLGGHVLSPGRVWALPCAGH